MPRWRRSSRTSRCHSSMSAHRWASWNRAPGASEEWTVKAGDDMATTVAKRTNAPAAAGLRCVADGLHVVAVGIPHEGAVVVRVVLGPHPRLVENLGPGRHGRVE